MPKKGKKGGKKGKKGGKGKKGAKGKKSGGKKTKDKKEDLGKLALQNAAIWETRLDLTEKSRQEFRETAQRLATENASLQDVMQRAEKDTIDVITFLKRQDQAKDDEIYNLNEMLKEEKRNHRNEKESIIDKLSNQIKHLEENISNKDNEIGILQNELKMVKEFRRKRAQMQKDLDEIKEAFYSSTREHQNVISRMEQKFFEEKMRMTQEADQKISELAERAHTEAIANLDETTRSVYKENVRLSEALNYHIEEGERLKKRNSLLETEIVKLRSDMELSDKMIKEKVKENKKLKTKIQQLESKTNLLEVSLSHAAKEFETERDQVIERCRIENESAMEELGKVQRLLELKTREMVKVKKLARNILDQRQEIERFFLEALDQVRQEIIANQQIYRRDAQIAYTQKMVLAHAGKTDFPQIRTFNKSETSTNNVYKDLAAAEKLVNISGSIEVSDLTWEQKERVLRYLFARMNGTKPRVPPQSNSFAPEMKKPHQLPPIQGPPDPVAFIENDLVELDLEEEDYRVDADNEDTDANATFLTESTLSTPSVPVPKNPPPSERIQLPVIREQSKESFLIS